MREQISSALDLIIQVTRLADGTRKITSVVEVTGMEGPVTATQEIFRYRRRGITPEGQVVGDFETTGVRPQFMERLRVAGVEISNDLFAEAILR
jgi:pilus assembly protein CpaF